MMFPRTITTTMQDVSNDDHNDYHDKDDNDDDDNDVKTRVSRHREM